MPPKTDPKSIRLAAAKEYEREAKADPAKVSRGILPAEAKRRVAKRTGLSVSRLASLVDPVYFEENGRRNPLPATAAKSPRSLAVAVRKRRDGGGTLGRWESVAAAASASLGRPVSERAVRALYEKGGGTLAVSYTGRGTRVSAPLTRADEAAEVEAAAK